MYDGIQRKTAGKKSCLNFGCGTNYLADWINIDTIAGDGNIIYHNVLNGLPFENDYLDAIYCSHVIEHFQLDEAKKVISECYRTLKKNGILRIVVPDLQNIINEYNTIINSLEKNPSEELFLKYKWIIIELFDQANRNNQGGQMKTFIDNDGKQIKDYIIERLGHIGDGLFEPKNRIAPQRKKSISSIGRRIYNKIFKILLLSEKEREYLEIGRFRSSGEVHYWMYDKVFLKNILVDANFKTVEFTTAFESNIPRWEMNNLDIVNNKVLHNSSIYAEAVK